MIGKPVPAFSCLHFSDCRVHRSRQRQATAGGSLAELKWYGANGCYMVIYRKQETFFLPLEQTPSERQHIQRPLKLLVYEAMAN